LQVVPGLGAAASADVNTEVERMMTISAESFLMPQNVNRTSQPSPEDVDKFWVNFPNYLN